jgi:ketosteroid isomerase-like protein
MAKPVSIADFIAITDQMARYCHHIDEGEAADWAACYTEDGTFDGPATPAPVKGRAALQAFAQATYDNSDGGKMRHQVANLTCDYGASQDEISARLYNLVTTWHEGGRVAIMAVCKVDFVRAEAGWRIRRNAYKLLA